MITIWSKILTGLLIHPFNNSTAHIFNFPLLLLFFLFHIHPHSVSLFAFNGLAGVLVVAVVAAELRGWDAVELCWWSISWLIDPWGKPADIWLMKQLGSVPAASPPAINILEALVQAERQQHPRAVWYRLSIMHYSSICEGAVRGAEIWRLRFSWQNVGLEEVLHLNQREG